MAITIGIKQTLCSTNEYRQPTVEMSHALMMYPKRTPIGAVRK